MVDTAEWAQSFVTAVETGHAGKTMQIVVALTVRSVEEDDVPSDSVSPDAAKDVDYQRCFQF